jgi:hypothetical protein
MEIGPLSEWVAAAAEICAVCVALFLPYYQEHKKAVLRKRNFILVLKRLSLEASNNIDSLRDLELFLKISYLTVSNAEGNQDLMVGLKIVHVIKEQGPSKETKNKVNELLERLK